MEIKSEYHTTQKTLFRRVNQIRKADGLCSFEEEGAGYRLRYCEDIDMENAFIVLKGKDGSPFRLRDGQEGFSIDLKTGDLLVYEFEDNNKVWFSTPALEGNDDVDIVVGYTNYGTVPDMVQAGMIINARYRNVVLPAILRDVIKKTPVVETETPQKLPEPCIQPDLTDQAPAIFKVLTRLFVNDDLKTAIEKIQRIVEYSDKQKGHCIRTHHVMHRHYFNGYCFMKGFMYTQAAQMRFGGRWLERLGFEQGRSFKIIAMKDLLFIVPMSR